MLWPKQVINISGTSTVLLGLFLLILKPVLRKIESTPALFTEPSDSHIESHCNNTINIPKRVVYSVHISALIITVVMAGAGERFEGNAY